MAEAKRLHITVITPARKVLDKDATSVVLPAFDGEWGILPGHTPFMALLGCGRLTVADANGERQRIAIKGGFLQVSADEVTILTSEAAAPDEIDAAAVKEELRELKSKSPKDADREAHEQKQAWAQARLKLLTNDADRN